ncbi:hypothetical protein HMSP1_19 [Sinorhizobium phage HMSP1-Susan]|nr:hypothetical protein HMSP1_19 [Sinorhizobium phage HMSP1-Susan]
MRPPIKGQDGEAGEMASLHHQFLIVDAVTDEIIGMVAPVFYDADGNHVERDI